MVIVKSTQVIDVQGSARMIRKTLKKLSREIHIECAYTRARKFSTEMQSGTPGKIHHDA